ncbi:hypothetical protein D3C74_366320 [compost metagenome]
MTRPATTPSVRYPDSELVSPRSTGPPAPKSRIANASVATRQLMRRVRSSYVGAISAGSAMYGTWNIENAVAASRNATSTQIEAATVEAPAGTANVSAKNTGIATAPIVMKRRLDPVRTRSRSLPYPMNGSITTSQTLAPVTTRPATAAGTASASVR